MSYSANPLEFGEYLKKLRLLQKLSLRQVSLYSGVSNAYLSLLENGKRGIPTPDILKKLAKVYEVDYNELMLKAGYIYHDVGYQDENGNWTFIEAKTANPQKKISKSNKDVGEQIKKAITLLIDEPEAHLHGKNLSNLEKNILKQLLKNSIDTIEKMNDETESKKTTDE